ncbi:hypothetical protein ACF0H5_007679 [Mactra antiquata]
MGGKGVKMPVTNGMILMLILLTLHKVQSGILMNKNEVLRKVNDITTTWTVSLVIDLQTNDNFITKTNNDIPKTKKVAEQLVEHYASPKEDAFLQKFVALSMEINNLKEKQDMDSIICH